MLENIAHKWPLIRQCLSCTLYGTNFRVFFSPYLFWFWFILYLLFQHQDLLTCFFMSCSHFGFLEPSAYLPFFFLVDLQLTSAYCLSPASSSLLLAHSWLANSKHHLVLRSVNLSYHTACYLRTLLRSAPTDTCQSHSAAFSKMPSRPQRISPLLGLHPLTHLY